jgi:hypothetical protein
MTDAPARKFVPLNVTGTVAPGPPLDGAIEFSPGAGEVTVNVTGALVPPEVVTLTLRPPGVAPEAIVNVAVI